MIETLDEIICGRCKKKMEPLASLGKEKFSFRCPTAACDGRKCVHKNEISQEIKDLFQD